MPMTSRARIAPSLLLSALSLGSAFAFGACSSGGDDDDGGGGPIPLAQLVAGPAAVGFTPAVTSGGLFVYLADESTSATGGTDFNGNGSKSDTVPVVVDAAAQVELNLGVAALELGWAGANLYLVVDEDVDGREWIGAADDDLVLVHWAKDQPLTALATLDRRGAKHLVSTGAAVFFARATGEGGPMGSTLAVVTDAAPLSVIPVASGDGGGELRPTLLGEDEGLVLLSLDETQHMRDLNGDTDMLDRNVLALLDGLAAPAGAVYPAPLLNTFHASVTGGTTPFRATRQTDGSGWLVGFLVNEEAQDETNFNTFNHPDIPASWVPSRCVEAGNALDVDTDDDVLFFLRFTPWALNPALDPPRNTGLVGKHRVVIAQDFVGTVSQESATDMGFGEPCDLNDDGDRTDDIFRWVRAQTPILPPNEVAVLFPPGDVPGGTFGIAELDGRWLLAVSEDQDGTDFNGDELFDLDILGWYDPAVSAGWTFDNGVDGSVSTAAASWMGEIPGRQHVGVGFSELANGVDLNADGAIGESIATFAFFDEAAVRMSYPGFGVATEAANSGIVIQNGEGFYRVSELQQGGDLDGDGVANEVLLWRSRLTDGVTVSMFEHNQVSRRAVDPNDTDALLGAFVVDESKAGDVNGDGFVGGFALVYFAWPQ